MLMIDKTKYKIKMCMVKIIKFDQHFNFFKKIKKNIL